jgi:arylsulfatase A-like enzyme
VPAGRVSDEIVHAIDLFPTLAGITGADVPKDRPIDGVVAVSLNGRFAPRAALPVECAPNGGQF